MADDVLLSGNSDENDSPGSIQDIIRDMNQSQGLEKSTPPPASPDPAPAQPTKPNTPSAQKTDEPNPKPEPKPSDTATSKSLAPNDPAFVRGTDDTSPAPSDEGAAASKDAAPAEDTQVFSRLSELTSGAIKSEQDFRETIEDYNRLLAEAEEGYKPKFKSEAHRLAYDLLANVPTGQEMETARRTLHTLSLDLTKLSDKDLLFEAYLLDPDNSDLTREKAWEYFDADFEKRFANAADDKLVERELQKNSRKAKETIDKAQKDFQAARESAEVPEGPSDEVVSAVSKAVKGFGGLEMAFSEDASGDDMLRIPVEDPKELQRLEEYASDPRKWWNDLLKDFSTKDGFDYEGFTREIYELSNHRMIKAKIYNHGYERGKATQLAKDRNSSSLNKDATLTRGRVPSAPTKEPASFAEAFGQALGN